MPGLAWCDPCGLHIAGRHTPAMHTGRGRGRRSVVPCDERCGEGRQRQPLTVSAGGLHRRFWLRRCQSVRSIEPESSILPPPALRGRCSSVAARPEPPARTWVQRQPGGRRVRAERATSRTSSQGRSSAWHALSDELRRRQDEVKGRSVARPRRLGTLLGKRHTDDQSNGRLVFLRAPRYGSVSEAKTGYTLLRWQQQTAVGHDVLTRAWPSSAAEVVGFAGEVWPAWRSTATTGAHPHAPPATDGAVQVEVRSGSPSQVAQGGMHGRRSSFDFGP